MSSTEQADRDVPEKYDWRNYETPTKTTAKFLEDLVGSEESPKSQSSKRSSQSSTGSFVFLDPQTEQAPQTVTPLPLHPPTSHPDNPSAQYSPPASEKPEHSSKAHKSQESFASSVPRRLSDEFQHSHRRSSPLGHDGTTSTTDGTSPTDSHPARHHTHTHNSHSRGHARSRSSSESLSSLLLVTTERLSRETARANDAERKSSEIMSLFKHTFEAKTKLERDLIRVQQELEMYKVQLDAAQKEIYRAQDVVDRVERERVAALADAARARDKIHKLNETRAIEVAMEEGRRFGFEEGLRQGRHVQPRRASHDEEEKRHKRNSNGSASSDGSRSRRRVSSRPPPASQPVEHPPRPPVTQPLPVPTRTVPATAAAAAHPPPPPPVHRHGTPPDVGNFQKLLPRPTITTPMPVQVPSTQPQPPPPMPPHQVPTTAHDDLSAHSAAHSELKTSNNNVDRNGPIHPIPVWNHSPSVMHERITLPPDNFIPTMDANSVIALPPPHELSRPVPPDAPPLKKNDRDYPPQRPRSQSRGRDSKRRSLRLVDHDVVDESGKGKNRHSQSQAPYHDPPPRDDASSFDYSAFSGPTTTKVPQNPPRDDSTMRAGRYESRYENPVYRNRSAMDNPSPPQRIAQEWRNANREFITPPSTTIDPPPMRPPSAASQSIPRSPSRRPREIVMPAPLAEVYLNTTRTPRADRPFSDRLTSPDPNIIMLSHTPPDIEVVTPSTHASSRISVGTVVDPVLLSPASAHRPIPLPDHGGPEKINITPHDDHDRTSSNEYSGRSRPLSPGPIPGMGDLNYKAYPPGFAPSLPKDHEAIAASGSDFRYPSSPLMR